MKSYLEKREDLLRERKNLNRDFRICRRASKTDPSKITPWDKQEPCRECGEILIYDSRDSEGVPHICWPCAYLHRASILRPDTPIDQLDADLSSLSDAEIMKRMEKTISQNKHGENIIKPGRRRL